MPGKKKFANLGPTVGTRLDAGVVQVLDELVSGLAWAKSRGDLVRALVHHAVWSTPREQLAELFTRAWAYSTVRERLGEAGDELRDGAARELALAAAELLGAPPRPAGSRSGAAPPRRRSGAGPRRGQGSGT